MHQYVTGSSEMTSERDVLINLNMFFVESTRMFLSSNRCAALSVEAGCCLYLYRENLENPKFHGLFLLLSEIGLRIIVLRIMKAELFVCKLYPVF